jgi:hypothetical protein
VLAVVAEKILREGAVEDFTEFFGHLEIGFDIDAEPLEFVGLISGADSEHQSPARQRVGSGNFGRKARRVIERQDNDCSTEPNLLRNRGTMRDEH